MRKNRELMPQKKLLRLAHTLTPCLQCLGQVITAIKLGMTGLSVHNHQRWRARGGRLAWWGRFSRCSRWTRRIRKIERVRRASVNSDDCRIGGIRSRALCVVFERRGLRSCFLSADSFVFFTLLNQIALRRLPRFIGDLVRQNLSLRSNRDENILRVQRLERVDFCRREV